MRASDAAKPRLSVQWRSEDERRRPRLKSRRRPSKDETENRLDDDDQEE